MKTIRPLWSRHRYAVKYKDNDDVEFATFVTEQDATDFVLLVLGRNLDRSIVEQIYEIVEIDHTTPKES